MALFDEDARKTLVGIGVGLGVAALLPLLRVILKDAGRPLAKGSIRLGILAYEKGRETAARWGEVVEDLVVEVRSEMHTGSPEAPIPQPLGPQANGGS
jgi:hypothetical protein